MTRIGKTTPDRLMYRTYRQKHLTDRTAADFGETRIVQYVPDDLKARIREAVRDRSNKGVALLYDLVAEAINKGWTAPEIARAAMRGNPWAYAAIRKVKEEK